MQSSRSILVKLFTEYYLSATQAQKDGKPIAYITAFTPVEILRAMNLICVYPESYSVVCAASNKSQELIQASRLDSFSQDLCSYSLLSFGADYHPKLPYGGLPEPDMLIATNNQCGTTLLWFKLLAQKKNIPLFIIDYPAAESQQPSQIEYLTRQYAQLIEFVKAQTGASLDTSTLSEQVQQSRKACLLWEKIHRLNQSKPPKIETHKVVDALFPIVVAKGISKACDYYEAILNEYNTQAAPSAPESHRILWHGYPMWFLPQKFPRTFDDQFQLVLNDYTLWWSLNYPDLNDDMETLAVAYSDTYLNRSIDRKIDQTIKLVKEYQIDAVICHANHSCRRALADIQPLRQKLREMEVPSVTIEADMCNPNFYSDEQVKLRIESFRDVLRV